MLVFQAGPDRGGNDLARLRDDLAEADRLVFLAPGQVGVVAAGEGTQGFPRLDRDVAVGLRCPVPHHFTRIACAFDLRTPLAEALVAYAVVELAEELAFIPGIPAHDRKRAGLGKSV